MGRRPWYRTSSAGTAARAVIVAALISAIFGPIIVDEYREYRAKKPAEVARPEQKTTSLPIQGVVQVVPATATDWTPPAVSIKTPTEGSVVSGTITISANATDNVGVVDVQFKLDGNALGPEVAAPPYVVLWNTTGATGAHTLVAVARDAAGNITTSASIGFRVSGKQR